MPKRQRHVIEEEKNEKHRKIHDMGFDKNRVNIPRRFEHKEFRNG